MIYRLARVDERSEQRWSTYALSLLAFSLVSLLGLYALLRLQSVLPFNPTDAPTVSPTGAFNVAVSFVTNTNWQWYSGETSMSHLTQMVGLTVQNFLSAGVGFAVVMAIVRGIVRTRDRSRRLGNFWVDVTRATVRILLPMSFVFALVLAGRGVVQDLSGGTQVRIVDAAAAEIVGTDTQFVPSGPVASQVAIKQLGTNGGGFFNANSAHPFENPDAVTNLLELWAILLVPLAIVVAFGRLVGDRRQARLLLAVMLGFLVAMSALSMFAESNGNPRLTAVGADQSISTIQSGGNMEGKEVRVGAEGCGLCGRPSPRGRRAVPSTACTTR